MLARRTRWQLAVFAILGVFGMGTVLADYLDLGQLLGFGQYRVTAEFTDATGLYPGAMVTYRGVEVGKVKSIDPGAHSATATLGLNDGVLVPKDVQAAIRSTSAIGENSVDLTPRRTGEPWLRAGDRIGIPDTATVPRTDRLITSLHDLAASVPPEALRTVLDELTAGLQGRSGDISTMLDSARTVLHRAGADLEPTVQLIDQLGPFLDTQHDIRGDTHTIAPDLASFTGQLQRSDGDLRALLDHAPPAVGQVTDLERRISPALPQLLGDLTSTGQVIRTQLPGVAQIFVLYPAIEAALQRVVQEPGAAPGSAHLAIRMSLNQVPPCFPGYVPMSRQRAFGDTSPAPTPADLYCKAAPNDPRSVRGVRNTPCANDPAHRGARVEDCPNEMPATDGQEQAGWYDPRTGNALLPDGRLYELGDARNAQTGKKPTTWQELLVK
jgi:phospholipid/cholesterol/gamma-HCH transport system substrate-binding protein